METQCGHIATCENTLSVHLDAKRVGCIIDHLQSILISNSLDSIHIHWFTIAMHRHNGSGLGSDSSFNLFGINPTGLLLDIHKHWFAAVPPDAMGGGHKAIRCSDDFSCNT